MEQKEVIAEHEEIDSVDEIMGSSSEDQKQHKNLVALAILLVGLFVGSLFVDVAQLLSRSGFSPKALEAANVVEAAGKTWVAYEDPKVEVQVITDSTCGDACDPSQAIVWMRRALPTLEAVRVDYNDEAGKALVEKAGVVSLPAFVFSKEVDGTDFYAQAEPLFAKNDDGSYLLDTNQLGIPAGKFLSLPTIGDQDVQKGPQDAKVTIVEFSDFQCPYCKAFQPILNQALDQYKDKVRFSYKHMPLPFHPQAENAALAAECANEQGKFFAYSDALFAKQDEWGKTQGTQKFKEYAQKMSLKSAQFNQCLDDKKYLDKVTADAEEAKRFGVNGTPGTFVNGQFINGLTTLDQIKKAIDSELAK